MDQAELADRIGEVLKAVSGVDSAFLGEVTVGTGRTPTVTLMYMPWSRTLTRYPTS